MGAGEKFQRAEAWAILDPWHSEVPDAAHGPWLCPGRSQSPAGRVATRPGPPPGAHRQARGGERAAPGAAGANSTLQAVSSPALSGTGVLAAADKAPKA